jgi:hypothetical protein
MSETKTSLTLYIPISVKQQLKEYAKQENMSVSQFITFLVRFYVEYLKAREEYYSMFKEGD